MPVPLVKRPDSPIPPTTKSAPVVEEVEFVLDKTPIAPVSYTHLTLPTNREV